jgi:CheY-like chemotaxis protein
MKKVLSIDDEPDILKVFKDALQTQGYEVLTTTDPDEGIQMLRDHEDVDLLLLDVKMPGKSGFDVYQEIKTFRDVPVLFITAYPKSFTTESDQVVEMWQNNFADGTTDILYKPFELDTFYDKVASLIGQANEEGDSE